jgi:hypothetical protein
LSKNCENIIFEKYFSLGISYILLNKEEGKKIFATGGWNECYSRDRSAPGWITLSRVGFNAARSQALISIDNQQHRLMGSGYLYLLEKEREDFRVTSKQIT